MLYEINYLVLQSKTEDLTNIRSAIKESIIALGGVIKEEKAFLKRKLAYEIKKERYGFHTVLRFETENSGECISQLKKKFNLSSKIARYIIIKAEDMPSLSDFFAKEKEEKIALEKNTKKQEDINRILADKDRTRVLEVNKEKKEESKKITQEKEKSEETDEKADDEKSEKPKIKQEEIIDKEENVGDNGKKKTDKDKDKDGKVSLDDLDEKLDEILKI